MTSDTKVAIENRTIEVRDLALKLGFSPEVAGYSVKIYKGDTELFEYQADTSRFIKRGYQDYVNKLNIHTYKAYLRTCLNNVSKTLKKIEKEENKARFTSCQYGNGAWAVYDNNQAKMITHYRSGELAKQKMKELSLLLNAKPDLTDTEVALIYRKIKTKERIGQGSDILADLSKRHGLSR